MKKPALEQNMKFYNYIEELNIYVLDYSGNITLEEGLFRMKELEKQFDSALSKGIPIKILIDVRYTNWESLETHNVLSSIARKKFDLKSKNICQYTAVLNNQYNFPTHENEHWFTNKDEAINWLLQQNIC